MPAGSYLYISLDSRKRWRPATRVCHPTNISLGWNEIVVSLCPTVARSSSRTKSPILKDHQT
ncbi:hypothetical protein C8R48DRAFT_432206 [Suillus tomentosus]|nr:hypothetical protein C8R48DRAFT_432206 [Suillus tomentosus]